MPLWHSEGNRIRGGLHKSGGLSGMAGSSPPLACLSPGNELLANNEAARCRTSVPIFPGPSGGCLTGQGSSSTFNFSLPEDPSPGRPTGCETVVTAKIVSKLCDQGRITEAVEALGVLVLRDCFVSRFLYYPVIKKCGMNKDLVLGRRVHAFMVKVGYESDTFLCNHILRMYASHGRLQDAMDVFGVVAEPDAFMWSSIISAHVKHGQDRQAIALYHKMRRSSLEPDAHVFVAALQACARGSDLESGQQVHADVLASGFGDDLFVCNGLVNMYAKCGSLAEAQTVFDGLEQKDVVTWTVMIAGYSQQGMGQEALLLYSAMRGGGMAVPDSVTFVCLLQACASVGSLALEMGKELHGEIRVRGHLADVFVACSLVNMYAKCGSLEAAQAVFDTVSQKPVEMWNALIAGYSQQGMGQKALSLYNVMQDEGIAVPNSATYVCLLQACASVGTPAVESGKQLHLQIRELGLEADVFVANSLVNMYSKCGSLEHAKKVFDGLVEKDVVTWTSLIAGYSQQGKGQEALRLYSVMQDEGIALPNSVTFSYLLQACASVGPLALETGKQLHAQIRGLGHEADLFVANSLVNMYAKCGSLDDAQKVFDGLGQKDMVTWNCLIGGYSQHGMGREALLLYSVMEEEGLAVPDSVTFVSLLLACASMGTPAVQMGKQLHAQVKEQGHEADVLVANSLVNMYAKCGSLEDARRVFDTLGVKDVVTWNAMITGYSQQGMGEHALRLYVALQDEGIAVPNAATFVCLLQACADVAALHLGRQLHAQINEQGLLGDMFVATSLINMYAKAGSMVDAQQLFDRLSEKDVVAWSTLIAGYACQGDSEVVFELVHRMSEDGIQPVGITILSVLSVCSHAGLVNKGREYFDSMSRDYSISPTVEHYTCMVDLLGRAGHLDEALAVASTMPVQPNAAVWHTLLGASQKWSNVEVGCHAFDEAMKLDKNDAAAYVLISNIYTGAQMWEQAQEMQGRRKRIRAKKQPGQSWWTDMDGLVHSFWVGDKNQQKSLVSLKQLSFKTNQERNAADISFDETEELLFRHSEKLAVPHANRLHITPEGTSIFPVKTRRLCVACHIATKYIKKGLSAAEDART